MAIGVKHESGTSIKIIEDRFPRYFSKFNKWDYYFFVPQACLHREFTDIIGHKNNTKYDFPRKELITNRYGKMLSGTVSFMVFYKQKIPGRYTSRTETRFPDTPDRIFGEIVFLPLLEELDSKNAINLLLEDLIGKTQVTLPPEWISKVKMPFIQEVDSNLEDLLKEIEAIEGKIKDIKAKKEEIESYKKLIYSDGTDLEAIFKKCLMELGGKVEPAKYSNEEYCLIYKNIEYPVEAKGVSKSISLAHLRQLIDYMLKYDEETGKKCKGILFGNPWKNTPIEKRNTNEKPNFPQNVIERAEDMNISLISSVDFFNIFCDFLENKIKGQKILDKIVSSRGLVKFLGD